MLEISRTKRKLKNDKEFKKYKSLQPFELYRQMSKAVNFGFLFGASAYTFMSNSLIPIWSDKQAEEFIITNKLEELKDSIIDGLVKKDKPIPDYIDYLTCATYIRNSFFKKYKGLEERIERNKDIVMDQGYTRSPHGVIRRLPLLMLSGKDDDYKEIAGYINIAANSEIQSMESCMVQSSIISFNRWARRNKLKTRIWNSVHDSVDFYIYRPELVLIIPKVYAIFERVEAWQNGIPLKIDFAISDPLKGEYYKGGVDAKEFIIALEAA